MAIELDLELENKITELSKDKNRTVNDFIGDLIDNYMEYEADMDYLVALEKKDEMGEVEFITIDEARKLLEDDN